LDGQTATHGTARHFEKIAAAWASRFLAKPESIRHCSARMDEHREPLKPMITRSHAGGRPRRVIVKEPNWLGDLVITLPALRAVRNAYPEAHLAVLVKQELAGFFEGVEKIDEVIPYRIGTGVRGVVDRWKVIHTVRARRFDLAVVLPRSFEAALWVAAARVPWRAGMAAQGRSYLLTDAVRAPAPDLTRHQAHDYLDVLREALGIDGSIEDVRVVGAPSRTAKMRAWLAERRRGDGPLIALAPAAAYGPAKEWPADRYAALVDELREVDGAECVLVGTPSERDRCVEVAAASRSSALIAAGATDVGDLLALLSHCDAFAGNDSGAMHVAGALGIPTVGIFGSTCPERTGPLGPRTRVLYEQIACSPCLERTCRFDHYDCLRRVSVAHVVAALAELDVFAARAPFR
jgi:heptosyltransferase II